MQFTDLTMPSFEGAKDRVLREKRAHKGTLLENLGCEPFIGFSPRFI